MRKIMLSAAAILVLGTTSAMADLYAIEGFAANCSQGNGAEGIVEIGSGEFSKTETTYTRVTSKKPMPDGFTMATYDMWAEGEPYGRVNIALKFQGDTVIIRHEDDGKVTKARRCR